jgi:hypothetical protein
MGTDNHDVAVRGGGPRNNLRKWWMAISLLLVVAILIEAVFAGAMLSGADWSRRAHSVNAVILAGSTAVAGLIALVTLRRVPHGTKLGLTLLLLAAAVLLQIAAGKLSAEGGNLMWVHVPLGVALAGFAVMAAASARTLGGG